MTSSGQGEIPVARSVGIRLFPNSYLKSRDDGTCVDAYRLRVKHNATFGDLASEAISRYVTEHPDADTPEVDRIWDHENCSFALTEKVDMAEPGETLKLVMSATDGSGNSALASTATRLKKVALTPIKSSPSAIRSSHAQAATSSPDGQRKTPHSFKSTPKKPIPKDAKIVELSDDNDILRNSASESTATTLTAVKQLPHGVKNGLISRSSSQFHGTNSALSRTVKTGTTPQTDIIPAATPLQTDKAQQLPNVKSSLKLSTAKSTPQSSRLDSDKSKIVAKKDPYEVPSDSEDDQPTHPRAPQSVKRLPGQTQLSASRVSGSRASQTKSSTRPRGSTEKAKMHTPTKVTARTETPRSRTPKPIPKNAVIIPIPDSSSSSSSDEEDGGDDGNNEANHRPNPESQPEHENAQGDSSEIGQPEIKMTPSRHTLTKATASASEKTVAPTQVEATSSQKSQKASGKRAEKHSINYGVKIVDQGSQSPLVVSEHPSYGIKGSGQTMSASQEETESNTRQGVKAEQGNSALTSAIQYVRVETPILDSSNEPETVDEGSLEVVHDKGDGEGDVEECASDEEEDEDASESGYKEKALPQEYLDWRQNNVVEFQSAGGENVGVAHGPWSGLIVNGDKMGQYMEGYHPPTQEMIQEVSKKTAEDDVEDDVSSTDTSSLASSDDEDEDGKIEEIGTKVNLTKWCVRTGRMTRSQADVSSSVGMESKVGGSPRLPKGLAPASTREDESESVRLNSIPSIPLNPSTITKQLQQSHSYAAPSNIPPSDIDAPPSNQELGVLLSSSRPNTPVDADHPRPSLMTHLASDESQVLISSSEPSEGIPYVLPPGWKERRGLGNAGKRHESQHGTGNTAASTRQSQSEKEDEDSDFEVTPSIDHVVSQAKAPTVQTRSMSATSAPLTQTAISVKIPDMSPGKKVEFLEVDKADLLEENSSLEQEVPSIRSFAEINKDSRDANGGASQDSTLEYVLKKSPEWLKNMTELDKPDEANASMSEKAQSRAMSKLAADTPSKSSVPKAVVGNKRKREESDDEGSSASSVTKAVIGKKRKGEEGDEETSSESSVAKLVVGGKRKRQESDEEKSSESSVPKVDIGNNMKGEEESDEKSDGEDSSFAPSDDGVSTTPHEVTRQTKGKPHSSASKSSLQKPSDSTLPPSKKKRVDIDTKPKLKSTTAIPVPDVNLRIQQLRGSITPIVPIPIPAPNVDKSHKNHKKHKKHKKHRRKKRAKLDPSAQNSPDSTVSNAALQQSPASSPNVPKQPNIAKQSGGNNSKSKSKSKSVPATTHQHHKTRGSKVATKKTRKPRNKEAKSNRRREAESASSDFPISPPITRPSSIGSSIC